MKFQCRIHTYDKKKKWNLKQTQQNRNDIPVSQIASGNNTNQTRIKYENQKLRNILAADHLVLVVLPGQRHKRWLNNSTTKPQNQMQCRLYKMTLNKLQDHNQTDN